MVRLTPNGLSVRPRQRAISFVSWSGVGWVSAVIKPSAPALATAATSSARPTHCMPPCTIGCSTPTSSVNRVFSMLGPFNRVLRRTLSALEMDSTLNRSGGEAVDQMALQEAEQHRDGDRADNDAGRQRAPLH